MRMRLSALMFLAVILLFLFPSAVQFYTDWLWFNAAGYRDVFLRSLNAQALIFGASFAVVFLFLFLNLRLARRTLKRPHIVLGTGVDGREIAVEGKLLVSLALPLAAVVAFFLAFVSAGNWLEWLTFFNAAPFAETDPLFDRDIGFYVFRLPIFLLVRQQAMLLTVLTLVGCGAYYVLSGSFVIEPPQQGTSFMPKFRLVPTARRHLGVLAALALALMAWGAWLEIPQVLLTPSSVVFGASYVDMSARVPFLWAGVVALSIGVVAALWYGFGRRAWMLPAALALYVLVSFAGGLYATFIQRVRVTPNEQVVEQPYIEHSIESTRRAYALDRVEERNLSGDAVLTADDIVNNAGTISNVRLWDHRPLLQTFSQIQEIRTYYDFVSVDNDRYMVDGEYRQVMLSAREVNSESLPNRAWINERIQYTHGYGVTLGPVNQVRDEGLPVLFIQDMPPVSTTNLRVDEPSIYYGELANDYVLVRANEPEFHYPSGADNETTFYEGDGGVSIGTLWRRIMFAIRFADTDILFTPLLNDESRIMFHRRIGERVRVLAPFLQYDSDPYLVVADGRLFWIQDAYTTTSNYPYSTPWQGSRLNYIRNSVKIVIDAYHGTVDFYLAEAEDPLALTLANIFPGLLKPLSDMPDELRRHVRYPEDIFEIQASIYMTFHMTNPDVFYNKEDLWQVPILDSEVGALPMEPYYTIMRLPGEEQTEFIQMLPFTPLQKDNLAAWLVARSDGDNYGRLLAFQFPKQKIVFGPRQIVGRINQDQVISPQITLWNQQGSQVIWGTLLVIPVEESLLYVRPLYLRSPEGLIPELKRVIVAYQNNIVMAETLTRALVQVFGPTVAAGLPADQFFAGPATEAGLEAVPATPEEPRTAVPPSAAGAQLAELAAEARAVYGQALEAQRNGDWAAYGTLIERLGEILRRMEEGR